MKTYLSVFLLLLFAFPVAAADVQASWEAVTQDEQGEQETISHYMLYWGPISRPGNITRPTDSGFSYAEERDVGNTTSSQQSGFTPGQTYYFAVAAVDELGNISAYSLELEVTIPGDQDGGVDGGDDGGEDAGADAGEDAGADEPPADQGGSGAEGGIKIEGSCGCDVYRTKRHGTLRRPGSSQGSGGAHTGLWLVALLAVALVRRKRE